MLSLFKRYLLPGFVFQSMMIGGGYVTGRELVEFFLAAGPTAGLLGMLVSTLTLSLVIAISFEFARMTRSYDYCTFCYHLLGRGWFLYEIAYFVFVFIVLSVLGAASGVLVEQHFQIPELAGTFIFILLVGVLVFFGNKAVETFFATWSLLLYLTFIILFVSCYLEFHDTIFASFTTSSPGTGWAVAGITYAGYNVAGVPAILFCIRHITTRKEAIGAGLLCGPLAMIPGILLFLALLAYYPLVVSEEVPTNLLLDAVDSRTLRLVFVFVMFGTFIETGAGLVHGVNERIAEMYRRKGKHMSNYVRPTVAVVMLVLSIYVATAIGIVQLIAQGYRYLTYTFIMVFVLPVLTIGLYRVVFSNRKQIEQAR